ncbi:hypothetical protein EUTSA_v10021478mg [Eutrema salsugineum]|uniref:RIN4 pathogenic type III effector avirulence factor Avr cleavage site domain-containing protein n=1 Tax=Eutrema salsugineum TaxID=72664 RepID=V4M345_EUTSA|nr:uncharacterized protein LOC18024637 [Eutrema salsugineum]ESQ49312.1 hypothetical protein EUTSA_v10021478mg [Eutrema salsugineum]
MANRPHVPKFGDWNNQDQPFTVVFDNARTNKRADLYESLENSEIKTQAKAPPPPPQPAPRNPRPEPPRPVREGTPRAPPPPSERNKVRAPPADQLYGSGGRGGGRDGGGGGGLYGGYGGGPGNQRQPQTPPRPAQPKPNLRGGSNGRGGTTIPPFPGSVGSGENVSYTHIFDQVKEERREGARSYGGSTGNTPSRPINGQHESPASNSSKVCCFPWSRKGSKY